MGQAVRRAVAAGRRRVRAGAFALVLGVAGLAQLAAQPTPTRVDRGRFTILAYAADSVLAKALLTRAVRDDTFPGLPRPRESVLIQIAPDARAFRDMVGLQAPEWGVAFALPLERRIVMQGRSAPSAAGDPLSVLRHELAHLALHEYLGSRAPRWFDEGYASWSAGEWNRENVIAANVGLALGGFRSLAALDSGFELGAKRADAAYALSYRAVAELASLDPVHGLTLLFRHWTEGRSLDYALRSGFGLTIGSFERRWLDRTRRRYGALALFADVTLGAFVLLLIITPLYLLRRRRDRERLARMQVADNEAEARERASALQALLRADTGSDLQGPPPAGPSS